MDKLKTPPLIRTLLYIYYSPNLKILDNKSIFYEEIKKQFSQVFHPELKSLRYSMGDMDYYDPQKKKIIGINTTCFKFGDFNYETISTFLQILEQNLTKFSKAYDIKAFNNFNFSYENVVVINNSLGLNFNDYFTIAIDVKGNKQKEFIAAEGLFVYKVQNGLLSLAISPILNVKNETEKFKYNIGFIANQAKIDLNSLMQSLKEAHSFIEDIFEKSLTKKYFDTLK